MGANQMILPCRVAQLLHWLIEQQEVSKQRRNLDKPNKLGLPSATSSYVALVSPAKTRDSGGPRGEYAPIMSRS